MSVGDAVPRRRGDVAATILLLVGHCLLVLYTMMASVSVPYAVGFAAAIVGIPEQELIERLRLRGEIE
jgi:uncharacterized membrane protein HdeD (DUF308 family)